MAGAAKERICVGAIAGAHGVRGLVRLKSFTERPEDITAYGPLTDDSGQRCFELSLTGRARDALLARIAGVSDRDQAAALRGTRLYVARADLPAPAEDEFYHADLIGLRAETLDGVVLGRVIAVHTFGGNDVLEISPEAGETILVPFTLQAVPVVELSAGRLVVDLPPETEAAPG
ncbi:MAG: ribosome maturation factor RimM [Alphaproteobacteria bacterium]